MAVLLVAQEIPGLRLLRLASFDAYQSLAPRTRRSAPAVIVAIDEPSLARYGQWPWPRTWLAELVSRVAEGRPAAIGLDILMPEPDRLSPARLADLVAGSDRSLAERLARLGSNDATLAGVLRGLPVVLGMAGLESKSPAGALTGVTQAPVRIFGGDPHPFVRRFEAALRSVEEIDTVAAGRGLVSADPEAGVVRRVPLVAVVGSTLVPTLGVEMLRVAAGKPALVLRVGRGGVEAVGVGGVLVPTQPDGSVWLHYSPHDPARFVSAADVLAGRADPRQFEQKLVLIGVTALGLSDYPATPVATRMSGVEIHAQLLEGIFEGDLLSRPRWVRWAEAAVLAAGGLLLILAVPALPVRTSTLLLLPVVGFVLALGLVLYITRGILFDAASPALALAVLFTAMLSVTLAEAESQRRALRRQVEQQREAAARLAGELEAARRIQMGSLPVPARTFPGETRFDLYALLEPAREVGGDLYDFFRLDADRLLFLVGDVSGHGLPGSLFMAVSKSLYKSTALRRRSEVAAVMREANTEISRDNAEGLFVTVLAAILDARTGELECCSAGHEAPYLLPRGGRALRPLADGGGPPLCAVEGYPYAAARYQMEPGDTLCLITDGVTEAMNSTGELYGRRRLQALLAGLGEAASAEELAEGIRRDVRRFAGSVDQSDDLAILVLRWIGPGQAVSGR